MFFDPSYPLIEIGDVKTMSDHSLVVIMQRGSQLPNAGSQIVDLSTVLVEHFGDLIKPAVDLLKPAVDLLKPAVDLIESAVDLIKPAVDLIEPVVVCGDFLRHFGKQLVDRCEVDAVAALHCGKKVTPKRSSGNRTNSTRGSLPREPRHEAVVIDDRALVEAFADRLGLVTAAHLEAQPAAVDFYELDFGSDIHARSASLRCG